MTEKKEEKLFMTWMLELGWRNILFKFFDFHSTFIQLQVIH